MVEKDDIESLLKTGSWRTSRSRSPHSYEPQRRVHEQPKPNIGVPRVVQLPSRPSRPPPPCVEDEDESLAKEHLGSVVSATSDEEPKHRGEIDQHPIILPVHEYNPERRFVIVSGAADPDAPKTTQARHKANTCRRYVLVTPGKGEESVGTGANGQQKEAAAKPKADLQKERLEIPKRKSHQDLPRLTTDFEHAEPSLRRSGSRRDRERPLVHQEPHDSLEARSKPSTGPPDSAFLSPATGRHTAAGRRDRAYSDARSESGRVSGRSPSTRAEVETDTSDRRRPQHSSRYPASPSLHRRASSTANLPETRDGPPPERPRSFIQPYPSGDPDEILAYMAPGDDFMSRKPGRGTSPMRRARDNSYPLHPRGAREMPGPSPSRRRPPRSTARERDGYSSSDDNYKDRRTLLTERQNPTRGALDSDYPPAQPPDQSRRPTTRFGAAAVSSLLATQTSQSPDDPPQPSPRSSTFPTDKSKNSGERSASPSSITSASSSRRPHRAAGNEQPVLDPRDGAAISVPNGAVSRSRASTLERAAPRPAPFLARQEPSDPQSPSLYWQSSRSSEQANAGGNTTSRALAQLPPCRWKYPAAVRDRPGSDQFLALKRADNFTICPDCYGSLFADTEFQHQFVPAPIRSADQTISCDFGSSPWYRIAYLMTLQHGYPDLRLLQGIASVAARSQACAGSQLAPRIWYSMMAPTSRRPIQTFSVCLGCAKSVEVLLPNLAGVFVPLDAHEPTWGICELHFAPDRKRFFDYFDEMRTTSAVALSRRTAPNLLELVDRVREISLHEECMRNTPIANRRWHVLERVPDFTVCEECFNAVVWPMIEDEDCASELPRNFYKYKQPRSVAACQLYSDRMRRVFLEACESDNFEYLAACVYNRQKVMAEVKARYDELQMEDQSDPKVQQELAALARRFREAE